MRRRITITHPDGLHARPAADLVRLAQSHPGGIRIAASDGTPADAASVLAVMTLALEPGSVVDLDADGPDADDVLETAAAILDPSDVRSGQTRAK